MSAEALLRLNSENAEILERVDPDSPFDAPHPAGPYIALALFLIACWLLKQSFGE